MSCTCQVKNPDPSKPCPACGDGRADTLLGAQERDRMERDRIPALLKFAQVAGGRAATPPEKKP